MRQRQVGSAAKTGLTVREAASHQEDSPLRGSFGIFLLSSIVNIFYKEQSDFTAFQIVF